MKEFFERKLEQSMKEKDDVVSIMSLTIVRYKHEIENLQIQIKFLKESIKSQKG